MQYARIIPVIFGWAALMAAWAGANPAMANARYTAHICDAAASRAAFDHDVPEYVMRAMARVDTGRTQDELTQPWPWTVTMEGRGVWFETEQEARHYVFRKFRRGARRFSVGCFQLDYTTHAEGFTSLEEMMDPHRNAQFAARELKALFETTGNWTTAVGSFRTSELSERAEYQAQFHQMVSELDPYWTDNIANDQHATLMPQAAQGSLVPQNMGGARPILLAERD